MSFAKKKFPLPLVLNDGILSGESARHHVRLWTDEPKRQAAIVIWSVNWPYRSEDGDVVRVSGNGCVSFHLSPCAFPLRTNFSFHQLLRAPSDVDDEHFRAKFSGSKDLALRSHSTPSHPCFSSASHPVSIVITLAQALNQCLRFWDLNDIQCYWRLI